MSYLEKALFIVIGVLLMITAFLYLPSEEIEQYFDMLALPDTQQEGIIGLLFLKEDIIPYIADELKDGDHNETARIGAIKVLGRKYTSSRDERIEDLFREIVADETVEVQRQIYKLIAESHESAMLDLYLQGLEHEDYAILRMILKNAGGFKKTIAEDENQEAAVRARLLVLRDLPDEEIGKYVSMILSGEVKRLVEEAEKEAENFNFVNAEELYAEARSLLPENLLLNYSYGKYLYRIKDETEAGMTHLEEYGFLQRIAATDTPPEIDGVLDDPVWENAPRFKNFQYFSGGIFVPATIEIDLRMFYDKEYLYIGAISYGNYTKMVAHAKGRDGNVWQDDCTEIFFDTDLDESSYIQLIMNFIGTIYDATNEATKGRRRQRSRTNWNGTYKLKTKLEIGEYWGYEIAIPWKNFDLESIPGPGTVWGFNFVWAKQTKPSQYAQWTPTYGSAHMPWYFGYLVFE